MSLTSNLRDPQSPIHEFLFQSFPNVGPLTKQCRDRLSGSELIHPPSELTSGERGTIGTAFDYRLRYYFFLTPYQQLVAWHGLMSMMASELGNEGVPAHLLALVKDSAFPRWGFGRKFFAELEKMLQEIQPAARRLDLSQEDLLARYCVGLALFEQFFRARELLQSPLHGLPPKPMLSDVLSVPSDAMIADLCALSWAFFDNYPAPKYDFQKV